MNPPSPNFHKKQNSASKLSLAPREWGLFTSGDFAAKKCATSELAAQVWTQTEQENNANSIMDNRNVRFSEPLSRFFLSMCDVARMGEGRGVYRVLVGKPKGKRPLGRPRRRWEDNIRMALQEVGLRYEDWIGLAQDRDRWRALVSAVRNLRVP